MGLPNYGLKGSKEWDKPNHFSLKVSYLKCYLKEQQQKQQQQQQQKKTDEVLRLVTNLGTIWRSPQTQIHFQRYYVIVWGDRSCVESSAKHVSSLWNSDIQSNGHKNTVTAIT